jgi:hypothetical protein
MSTEANTTSTLSSGPPTMRCVTCAVIEDMSGKAGIWTMRDGVTVSDADGTYALCQPHSLATAERACLASSSERTSECSVFAVALPKPGEDIGAV